MTTKQAKERVAKDVTDLSEAETLPEEIVFPLIELKEAPFEYISTGFSSVDENLGGGFRTGCTYLIASVEKGGKSTLLRQMVYHFTVGLKLKVAMVDTEQSINQAFESFAAIKFDKEKRKVTKEEMAETAVAMQENLIYLTRDNAAHLLSKDGGEMSKNMTMDVLNKAAETAKVIIVDNVTAFGFESDESTHYKRMHLMNSLAKLSKQTNTVVIMVGHIRSDTISVEGSSRVKDLIAENRLADIFTESITIVKRPRSTDVYGGGALTQLDGKILLWRPFQNMEIAGHMNAQSKTALIFDSQRYAKSGTMTRMTFDGEKAKFKEDVGGVIKDVWGDGADETF